MGSCVSSQSREDNESNETWRLWCFPLAKACQTTEPWVPNPSEPKDTSCEPQRRPAMELSKNQVNDGFQLPNLGLEVTSTVIQPRHEAQRKSKPGTETGRLVASGKKRKRSLSMALQHVAHRRNRTALERPKPEWRISLRSFGTRSPLPDFACYALAEVPEDDTGSSLSRGDRSPAWPLSNFVGHSGAQPDGPEHLIYHDALENINATASKTQHPNRRHRLRARSRALSDPLRFVRRKRTSPQHKDASDVNAEIQELRVLVAARQKQSISDAAASSSTAAPHHHDHHHHSDAAPRAGPTRSKSRGHVPAIAPRMKVNVRSELLSDIGSALSRPLALAGSNGASSAAASDGGGGGCPQTPATSVRSEHADEGAAWASAPSVSPDEGAAAADIAPSEYAPTMRAFGARSAMLHSSSSSSVTRTATGTATASTSQRTSAATSVSVAPAERAKLMERYSGASSTFMRNG